MNMKNAKEISTKHVDVIDGIRAISVIIVLVFHFWQQTWIFPDVKTPFLSFLHIRQISFTPFARVGYLFVDMMVLISGFLLFLPVARSILLGEPMDKWRVFFRKRAARILPSYLLCIAILFIYSLATGAYGTPIIWKTALRDLLLHLTFMHTWTIGTYFSTCLNVVLWTLAIEVWFYIIFPLIAMFIRRWKNESSPVFPLIRAGLTAVLMTAITLLYIYGYVLAPESAASVSINKALSSVGATINSGYTASVINQLPAFFGTYAIGLVGATIYVFLAKHLKRYWFVGLIGTALSILFIVFIVRMVKDCSKLDLASAQQWQVRERLKLSLVFMGFILSTAFSLGFWRFLFSNKLMVFLSAISYNLYIWHQWLCVKIKNDWRIPAWEGDTPPNQWGTPEGKAWSSNYALVITIAAFAVAILVTYLYERPMADLINGKKRLAAGTKKKTN